MPFRAHLDSGEGNGTKGFGAFMDNWRISFALVNFTFYCF